MANKHKIIIRADGGEGIGMGHIMRTLVLADYLKQYVEVVYVCNEYYGRGIAFLKQKGYEVYAYKKELLLEKLISQEADCILTDSYEIDEEYVDRIRHHFKVVGYIDDNCLMSYNADFIVNQNFGAESIPYEVNKDCQLLLGTQYLLVRETFRKIPVKKVGDKVKEVLITVGGSDEFNLTSKLLRMIEDMDFSFHVVIGPAFPYEKELENEYKRLKNIIFHKQPDMARLMSQCDLAISSCGSTLYELGLLAIPTLGISVADNQIPLAQRMHQEGLIWYLGDVGFLEDDILRTSLLQLVKDKEKRENMHRLNQERLNKEGVVLVAKRILDLIEE